jgi:hypothetical protein
MDRLQTPPMIELRRLEVGLIRWKM